MSNVKKPPVFIGPRRDVVASLKMASMEFSKPALPAGMRSAVLIQRALKEANIT